MKTNPLRIALPSILAIGLFFSTACSEKPRQLTEKEAAEIRSLSADANMALIFKVKDYERAQRNYEAIVKIDATNPAHWLSLGMNQHRLDKKDDARKSYKKARSLAESGYKTTKNPVYLLERSRAIALLGDVEGAMKAAEKARELHPDNREVSLALNPNNPAGLAAIFRSESFKQVSFLKN